MTRADIANQDATTPRPNAIEAFGSVKLRNFLLSLHAKSPRQKDTTCNTLISCA